MELLANPRFTEAERQSFVKDFVVRPKIWDNEISFRERMVHIDRTLESYQRDAERSLARAASLQRRQHELNTLRAIVAFRARLMPPRMETNEQVEKFVAGNPPGTRFTAKDERGRWTIYRMPDSGRAVTMTPSACCGQITVVHLSKTMEIR